jgi:predicted aminopeptidase
MSGAQALYSIVFGLASVATIVLAAVAIASNDPDTRFDCLVACLPTAAASICSLVGYWGHRLELGTRAD